MVTFAGLTYVNGSVPLTLLAPLDGQPEATLRRDAAEAWNRAKRDVFVRTGITLTLRGWNRTLAEQERFFFERYEPRAAPYVGPFSDVRWYRGVRYVRVRGASAAIPGTSNHGWGLAVDVVDYGGVGEFDYPRRVSTFPILARHGWTDTEGRGAIQEPWHLVYDPSKDTRPAVEEDMTPLEMLEARFKTGRKVIVNGKEVDEEVRVVDAFKATYFYGDYLVRALAASTDRTVAETSAAFHQLAALISGGATDQIDVEALADALAARLPKTDAKTLLDALAARLES